ncbi:MAG: hypothetical protein QOF81_3651, partial [Acidimicrobiaceae bacterium]|nr:hypothetical protein [Acidimicrobiaceae bacterium]
MDRRAILLLWVSHVADLPCSLRCALPFYACRSRNASKNFVQGFGWRLGLQWYLGLGMLRLGFRLRLSARSARSKAGDCVDDCGAHDSVNMHPWLFRLPDPHQAATTPTREKTRCPNTTFPPQYARRGWPCHAWTPPSRHNRPRLRGWGRGRG